MSEKDLATADIITAKIVELRGEKVILDRDIAALYGVETFNLNKAVKRNIRRFPDDFMFQLNKDEFNLIFQNGISTHGGTRKLPYAFTEQGIAMLSSVLNSERAIMVNIHIMRAFVRYRQFGPMSDMRKLTRKIDEIEKKVSIHDDNMKAIFTVIRKHFLGHPKES